MGKEWDCVKQPHHRKLAHDHLEAIMIPKKIHYVWVGTQPKSDLILRCMASWKKHLPDYEIIEWNNEKYETIKNKYSEQAFQHKKWAFVSDYIRLHALYNEGGIYLDTDVEITSNIDEFLVHNFFSGHEIYQGSCLPILSALMGAEKGNKMIKDLLDHYSTASFETPQGLDMVPNTLRITEYFEKNFGLKRPYDCAAKSILDENSIIYPVTHFCTPSKEAINFSIHHFNGSWVDGYHRKNKASLFGKYVIARFRKNTHIKSNVFPLYDNEKLIASFNLSRKTVIGFIKKGS